MKGISEKIKYVLENTSFGEYIRGKWFSKLRDIDNIAYSYPGSGVLFSYDFPNRPASFTVEKRKGDEFPVIKLTYQNECVCCDRQNDSKKEEYDNVALLESLFKEKELSFAPGYTAEFKKILLNSGIGDRILLNSGLEISCVSKDKNRSVFKSIFDGDIFNVTLDGFKKAKTYIIGDNPEDIQKLFGKAYSSRCSTINMRVRLEEHDGEKDIVQIENLLKDGEILPIKIGQLSINAIKNGKVLWYGSDGNQLTRDMVKIIMGWAKGSLPQITGFVGDKESIYAADELSPEELRQLNDCAFSDKADMFLDEAYKISKTSPVFVGTTGLKKEGNGYELTSYVFYTGKNGERCILKASYDDSIQFPSKISEVSIEEFRAFYEEKFKENIVQIQNFYEEQLLSRNIYNKQALDNLIEAHLNKKKDLKTNPAALSFDRVSKESKALLKRYMETGVIEESVKDAIDNTER